MARECAVVVVGGPINVSFRRRRKEKDWLCTALQFDLVGIGASREEAFAELRSVVEDYLEEVLTTEGPVRFYNLSDEQEWGNPDQKVFDVQAYIAATAEQTRVPSRMRHRKIRDYRDRVRAFDLVPANSSV